LAHRQRDRHGLMGERAEKADGQDQVHEQPQAPERIGGDKSGHCARSLSLPSFLCSGL
jgi:hypothetical protein